MKVNKISFSTEDIKVKIYYKLIFAYILIVEINKDDFLEFSIWNKNLDKNKINIEKIISLHWKLSTKHLN